MLSQPDNSWNIVQQSTVAALLCLTKIRIENYLKTQNWKLFDSDDVVTMIIQSLHHILNTRCFVKFGSNYFHQIIWKHILHTFKNILLLMVLLVQTFYIFFKVKDCSTFVWLLRPVWDLWPALTDSDQSNKLTGCDHHCVLRSQPVTITGAWLRCSAVPPGPPVQHSVVSWPEPSVTWVGVVVTRITPGQPLFFTTLCWLHNCTEQLMLIYISLQS